MVSEYLIGLLYTVNTKTYNLSSLLLISFKNQKYLGLATLAGISFAMKMNCLHNFLKRSEVDATKTHIWESDVWNTGTGTQNR